MDESQEKLLKRLALLKQKIMEQYPELTEKMADDHMRKYHGENPEHDEEDDKEHCFVPVPKKHGR